MPQRCIRILALTSAFALSVASARPQSPPSFSGQTLPLGEVELLDFQVADTEALSRRWRPVSGGFRLKSRRVAEPVAVGASMLTVGTGEELAADGEIWRLRIRSRGALHLSVVFEPFELPAEARLWIYDPAGSTVRGPFTAADASPRGRLFTPVVPADEVVIELHLPGRSEAPSPAANLGVLRVHHGFAPLLREPETRGPCNNDVACPEGDLWRDQIRAVAMITIDGTSQCTGQLVNNTAFDERPLFLSAFHCGATPANEDTLVFYWNYQSPVCGQQGGGTLDDFQIGSTYLAGEADSDFVLVELDEMPDPDFDVHYGGWDVSGLAAQGSVGIHHPSGQVKAISFNDDPLVPSDIWVLGIETHWEVDDWEDGTTEPGSSGSCLFDRDSGLCVGVLTGGFASCSVIAEDYYGRLDYAWDAGPAPSTRLRDWLDPRGMGVDRLGGIDPGGAPVIAVPSTSRGGLLSLVGALALVGCTLLFRR